MLSARRSKAHRVRPVTAIGALLLACPVVLDAQEEPPPEPPGDWGPTAITYENVPYPHAVHFLDVELFEDDYRMAYMDVAAVGRPNGRVVVLFHGMNFFAAAFRSTIEALRQQGFRVIAVDRLGYGRSSKPLIHYNLHIPARNTKALLDELGIERAAIVGHSMGGMVATRFASTYPETTTHVVMVNQIGLTDTRPGRPWTDPEVVYEWRHIATKALVIGGAEDRLSADYPAAARHVAEELQNAELVIFPGVGHAPAFEIPERFHAELIRFLLSDPSEPADQGWRATGVGRG